MSKGFETEPKIIQLIRLKPRPLESEHGNVLHYQGGLFPQEQTSSGEMENRRERAPGNSQGRNKVFLPFLPLLTSLLESWAFDGSYGIKWSHLLCFAPCEAMGLPSCHLSPSFSLSFHVPITRSSQILLHTTLSFAGLAELFSVKIQIGRHFY